MFEVNVRDYGAVGDGITDDYPAIQSAIDALDTRGGIVLFPSGTYNISSRLIVGDGNGSTINSTKNGVKLRGQGAGFAVYGSMVPTILKYTGPKTSSVLMEIKGKISDLEISGMFFDCNGDIGGISGTSFSGGNFKNLKIVNPASHTSAIHIMGGGSPTGNYNTFNIFENISIALLSSNSVGIFMDGNYSLQNDTWISQLRNIRVETVAGATNATCAWFKFVDSCSFHRCHFDSKPEPTSQGVIFDATSNAGFPAGMSFYDCSVSNTTVYETPTNKIRKNYFYGYGSYDYEVIPAHPNLCGITDTGLVFGDFIFSDPWKVYYPVITSAQGQLGNRFSVGRYRKIGNVVHIQITVYIYDNSTGSGDIRATLPSDIPPVNQEDFFGQGRDTVKGGALLAQFGKNSRTVFIKKYNDSYPAESGSILKISGCYEVV